ncbi:hypothetical protein [Thermodesulfatator atlanticus]
MSEVRCTKCGKRYQLKGEREDLTFLSLPCPECGGALESVESLSEPTFLLDKPLALVFWEGDGDRAAFLKKLTQSGYEVRTIKKPSLLNQWLRFNTPALIVFVTEDENAIKPYLAILNSLPMPERRQMFVVWISSRARTLDPRLAYLESIEMVMNSSDLERFADVLERGQKIWKDFYTPLKQVEEALGKEI